MEFKHKKLWNRVLYGSPKNALEAASTLYKLGEMSDLVFQNIFLTICYEAKEQKAEKKQKRRKKK